MIKKILKWTLRLFLGSLLFIAILYAGFHLWEYSTGGKYVKYLKENSQTIPLGEHFAYDIMEKDIERNQLILVGEVHGFEEPLKFDVDFFKYLHENHSVNHYIAELDFIQANLLNDFLVSGDEELLSTILKRWVVVQGRDNQDYFDKYRALHQYYQQLPDDNKFEFIGIDRIQDNALFLDCIDGLFPDTISEDYLTRERIDSLEILYANNADTLFILSHLKSNLNYVRDKMNREEILFQNFQNLYKEYKLEESKLYGYFGLYHVFQYRVNGNHPLASKIRKSDLGFENKILSVNFMMNDSHMVMPSSQLPEFMRDEGKYTKMPVSADNMLFMYIYGIKDFKRMTPNNNKSLIKMTGENNPYAGSKRLNMTIQLLPVTDLFELTDKGKPYVQYTVFIRNSDWAEPMK
ncbi:MAG: hypothetical protein ACI94Y_003672 [Maribacter sp.]|jgi:hypothetical protein